MFSKNRPSRVLDRVPPASHTKLRQNLNAEVVHWTVRELDPMNDNAKDTPKTPAETAHRQRVLQSEELLQGAREILIAHGEETYRLRLTRNGKLILHK